MPRDRAPPHDAALRGLVTSAIDRHQFVATAAVTSIGAALGSLVRGPLSTEELRRQAREEDAERGR